MRTQFPCYKSFDDVYQDLNDKQKIEFIDNMFDVQFLRKKIEDVEFKDNVLKHIWNAQKHSIEKSILGYLDSQKSKKVINPFLGCYADEKNISLKNTLGGDSQPPKEEGEGEEEGEEKEQGEGIFNASFHFAPLSELVSQLKAKKDTQKHKPLKTIKEFDEYLKGFSYETEEEKKTVDDVLDIGYMFIRYRDYMFSLTKETIYRLLSSKSVEDFIDVIYSDFRDIDLESLFNKMEAKGWASLQKGKGWKL